MKLELSMKYFYIFCVLVGCNSRNYNDKLSFSWIETGLQAHNPYKIFDGEMYYYFKVIVKNPFENNYHINDSNSDFRIEFENGSRKDTLRFFLLNDFVLKARATDTLKFKRTNLYGISLDSALLSISNLGLKGRLIYKCQIVDSSFSEYHKLDKSDGYRFTASIVD